MSFTCHSIPEIEDMKPEKRRPPGHPPRVEKVLLQMTQHGNDWAGKATRFSGPTEYHFGSLKDLFEWLKSYSRE